MTEVKHFGSNTENFLIQNEMENDRFSYNIQ